MANLYTLEHRTLHAIQEELQALLIKRPFTVIKSPTEVRPEIHRSLWLTQPVLVHSDPAVKEENSFLIYADNLQATSKMRLEIVPREGNVMVEISLEHKYAIITCHNRRGETTVVYFVTVDNP